MTTPCAVCHQDFEPTLGGVRLLIDERRMPICGPCALTADKAQLTAAIDAFRRVSVPQVAS